ncbi:DapH/DapD/GlmU-related protein [Microbacterium laevaniformans]|uniref:DapH/DapD/GlmU-related protein n=1 Tax=Microbacterium laevaniformans TaxID=36807 RepID=UPI00362E9334
MGVQIVGRDDHAIDELGVPYVLSTWVGDREATPRDRVSIGRDVWIGGRSTVLGGVTIGDGALIGSASVVTKDVAPFAVVVGNPARVVGERFPSADQERHLDALSERLAHTP